MNSSFFGQCIIPAFFRKLGRTCLASIVIPAGILSGGLGSESPPGKGMHLVVLPLPPHVSISRDDDFGREGEGIFYFLSRNGQWRLFRLRVEHPMGAKDLWRESWSDLDIPPPPDSFRVMTSAIGDQHLFLAGMQEGSGPLVRSYQISGNGGSTGRMTLTGQVDYFPPTAGVSVRTLHLDRKARILWLGYDNGRIESGRPFIQFPDRLLWADPAGYLPLPKRTGLLSGPPPLLSPRDLRSLSGDCFSCRFYVVPRKPGGIEPKANHPIRSRSRVGSSLGLLPAGGNLGLFMGRKSYVCHVPGTSGGSLSDCHAVLRSDLPVAALWWGNSLAYLFPPGHSWPVPSSGVIKRAGEERTRWAIVAINPAFLQEAMVKLSPGERFPFGEVMKEKGAIFLLPPDASPRERTFSSGVGTLDLFGKGHLYRISSAD